MTSRWGVLFWKSAVQFLLSDTNVFHMCRPTPVLVIFLKSSNERARPSLPDAIVVTTAFLSPSSISLQVSSGAREDGNSCCSDGISIVLSCTSPYVVLLVEVLREAQSEGFFGVTAVDSVDVWYCCLISM